MIRGGTGGARTSTGLVFEAATNLRRALDRHRDIELKGDDVWYRDRKRGTLLQKNNLYTHFLDPAGVNWREILSKRLLPDDALLVDGRLLTIVEKKFQRVNGSVDEKLQTCDFKKKQYVRLTRRLGIKVQYCYVLNDWFKDPGYRDVLAYIENVGCAYFYNAVPIEYLGF